MIVIPAVDVRDGRCVRLREGREDQVTVFSEDPVAMARRWTELGAERLHVVDLDGAFAGAPRQMALIAKIVAAVGPIAVQAGGGLRDLAAIEALLEAGARWAVIGTRAALDSAFLTAACRRYPDRIIVAADGRGTRVTIRGWTEVVEETVTAVGQRALNAGAAALLYTDVTRDGTERGPNLSDTAALAQAVPLPVLASGGVRNVEDLKRLAAIPRVYGTIVGRALYTGALDFGAARAALAGAKGAER